MTNFTKALVATVGVSIFATTLSAASFNCRNASTATERAICGDKYLSQLDGKMGKLYHKASSFANIKEEQRDWINHRNRNCGGNEDCLYDLTKVRMGELRRIIRRGGGHHKSSHRGSVYSPARGVVCDKKSGFCADSYGISLGLTKEYLGQKQQDIWNKRMNGNFDASAFTFSNRIFCDTNIRTCYTSKLKDSVDHYFTNRLFR